MSRESKILIAVLVIVVGGMIGLFALANKSTDEPKPKGDATVVRDSSHKQGSGPVQLVEFGDYQCPACGAAYPNVKQLQKEYDGKVTFYFRNFPLSQIHKNAQIAAQAAEASNTQGKFWEMHDKLYETQKEWSEDNDPTGKFADYAKDLGMDVDKFKKDLVDAQIKAIIAQDAADGEALGINSTPTFYINGVKHEKGYTYPDLRDAVESALKQ